MTNEDDHPGQVVFYVYGIDADDVEEAWHCDGDVNDAGYDHDAAEAATAVYRMLKERFEWAEGVTGVAMGVREE